MVEIELSLEQAAEAERIADVLKAKMTAEINFIARSLASKGNRELLGATEFQIREAVHRLGAAAIDTALAERKKGGTTDPAESVRTARMTPGSRATARAR